jgi:hypothetical protein
MSYVEAIENTEPEENQSVSEQLTDIKEAMKLLAEKALELIPEGIHKERARCYWYAHIVLALDSDNEFLGKSMIQMQDTIDDIQSKEEEETYTPKAFRD